MRCSSKGLSPRLIQLLRGLFYQFGPAKKCSGGFSVYFPGLHHGITEHVLSISFSQDVFITEEFAQIFCGALVPD